MKLSNFYLPVHNNNNKTKQKILLIVSLQSYFIYPDTIKRDHFILIETNLIFFLVFLFIVTFISNFFGYNFLWLIYLNQSIYCLRSTCGLHLNSNFWNLTWDNFGYLFLLSI